jgi:hypothetical protein
MPTPRARAIRHSGSRGGEIVAGVSLALLALAACNAVVGLDALEFATAASSAIAASSASAGGAAGTGGAGGTGGCSPEPEVCGNDVDENCNGRAPDCIVDDGLVARYYIDEAAAGPGPGLLQDAAPDPLPLTILDDGGEPVFVEIAGSRALAWETLDASGRAAVTSTGTKLETMLQGSPSATIEVVVAIESPSSAGAVIFHFADSYFTLFMPRAAFVELQWKNGIVIGRWQLALVSSERTVLHAVLDTTEDEADARVTLYAAGAPVRPAAGATPPALDETIDLAPSDTFVLGNADDDARSFRGRLHYAAVYASALSASDVMTNAAILEADDDSP